MHQTAGPTTSSLIKLDAGSPAKPFSQWGQLKGGAIGGALTDLVVGKSLQPRPGNPGARPCDKTLDARRGDFIAQASSTSA